MPPPSRRSRAIKSRKRNEIGRIVQQDSDEDMDIDIEFMCDTVDTNFELSDEFYPPTPVQSRRPYFGDSERNKRRKKADNARCLSVCPIKTPDFFSFNSKTHQSQPSIQKHQSSQQHVLLRRQEEVNNMIRSLKSTKSAGLLQMVVVSKLIEH